MKSKQTTIISICALLLGAISFYSCENPTGLGSRLHLNPPVVNITKPDMMSNVGETLEIAGTATDDQEVAVLYITIEGLSKEGEQWKREWIGDRGNWRGSAAGRGIWTTKGNAGSIDWSAAIPMNGAPAGEYLITVKAENNVKNSAAVSVQQRRVIFDNSPPSIKMVLPKDLNKKDDGGNYLHGGPGGGVYDDIKTYFDETYDLHRTNVLEYLHNQTIKLQWEVNDDFSIQKVIVRLTDKDDNYYYEKTIEGKDLNWNGNLEINEKDIQEQIDGSEDRTPVTGKTYLRVQTTAIDEAGNKSDLENHGWLVYWPEADKPWAEGVPEKTYSGTEVQGQAYDDDGVAQVALQLYPKGSTVPITGYEEPVVIINTPPSPNAAPSGFFNWSFTAPEEPGEYMLKCIVTDMNNPVNEGERTFNFTVMDTSAPRIQFTGPSINESLFGDANGDFSVDVTVTAKAEPEQVRLVWINPTGSDPDADREAYKSADFSGWETLGSDGNGNIIWEMNQGTVQWDDTEKRYTVPFSKPLNLFTDLGIGKNGVPLSAQTFIVRLQSGGGGQRVTETRTVKGDVAPPVFINQAENREIAVYDAMDNLKKEYTKSEWDNTAMEALQSTDKMYLYGSWSDDSFTGPNKWTTDDSHFMKITAQADGTDIPVTLDYTTQTWEAGPLVVDSDLADAGSCYITVKLTDLGCNSGEYAVTPYWKTDIPKLIEISSNTPDGVYSAGKHDIDIVLLFNADVTYSDESTYKLKLNTGGTASYREGNGTGTHTFTYDVGAGENTGALKVTGILGLGDWGNAVVVIDGFNRNLDTTKSLKIDTIAPTVKEIKSLTGTSPSGNEYFKETDVITLLVTFNENITYNTNNTNNVTLKLRADSGNYFTGPAELSGLNALMFSYTVQANHNTADLQIDGVTNSAGITDTAGNELDTTTLPSFTPLTRIDTKKPNPPAVSGITPNETYKSAVSITVTRSNVDQEDGSLEYSLDGGSSFNEYTQPVNVSTSGDYTITARQKDKAGNESPFSSSIQFTIEPIADLLQRVSSKTKTYIEGDEISISLRLREAVTVSGIPSLILNAQNSAGQNIQIPYKELLESGTVLVFTYMVQDGDKMPVGVDALDIISINLDAGQLKTDSTGQDLKVEFDKLIWGTKLSVANTMDIDTTPPQLIDVSFSALVLTLTFDDDIDLGTGDIILTHEDSSTVPYYVPAVLTKAEYQQYEAALHGKPGNVQTLSDYYNPGTNGLLTGGAPDLSEKYILRYDINTNEIDSTAQSVTNAMMLAEAHLLRIPVADMSISGKTLSINLDSSSGYIPPVKGVGYKLSFSKDGIVTDKVLPVGNPVKATTANGKSITVEGVNPPVIRVDKKEAVPVLRNQHSIPNIRTVISAFDNVSDVNGDEVIGEQPHNTTAKIDCQTPGKTISYIIERRSQDTYPGDDVSGSAAGGYTINFHEFSKSDTKLQPSFSISASSIFDNPSYSRGNTLPLLTNDEAKNYTRGYKVNIKATIDTVIVEEIAYRSVVIIERSDYPIFDIRPTTVADSNTSSQLWLRGGNVENGSNTTLDFPLTWFNDDKGKGIKLMTQMHHEDTVAKNHKGEDFNDTINDGVSSNPTATNTWYWMSWGITNKAYFHFLAGTTEDGDTTDAANNGPLKFSWLVGQWSASHEHYPLYAGASLIFNTYLTRVPTFPDVPPALEYPAYQSRP